MCEFCQYREGSPTWENFPHFPVFLMVWYCWCDTFISQGIRLSSFGKIPLWRIYFGVLAEAASQVHGIVGCFLSLCTDNFTWFAVASRKSLFFSAKLCTRGPLLPTPGLFQHLPRAKYPSVFSCWLKYSKLPRRLLHFGEQHACLAFLNIKQVVLGRWFGAGTDYKSLPFDTIKLFFCSAFEKYDLLGGGVPCRPKPVLIW